MMGYVYIIKSGSYYKIGKADNIKTRLSDINVSSPVGAKLIYSFETKQPYNAEKLLHKIFKNKRLNGEWFNLSSTDLNFISTINGYHNDSFTWSSVPVIETDPNQIIRDNKVYSVECFNGNIIHITERQILEFLRTTWKRQQDGKTYPLSHSYWCKQRRFNNVMYKTIIELLIDCGAIINRRQGATGMLAMAPDEVMLLINTRFECQRN